jgi:hypothetical protein
MTRATTQTAADNFFFIRDHFRDASSSFWLYSGAAEIGVEFEDIWTSNSLQEALLEIARDMAAEGRMGEDQCNDFVDAKLKALDWCALARELTSWEE